MNNFARFFGLQEYQVANIKSVDDFVKTFGGYQFDNGLFRVFKVDDIEKWQIIVENAFKNFTGKFKLFSFDWLGRCFGIDLKKDTFGNILMFEIGTNDVLEIPCQFLDFLNEEIPNYNDECLASSFFYEWQTNSNKQISYDECVGYKIPLFLNGVDSISNLEISNMDVYWSILSQIINQI